MDLQHLRGKSVSRIRRIYFVSQGTVDTRAGALELRLQDGSFLLLDTHSDWTLHVKQEEWSDPFPPPLSAENAEFVRTHGKWTAFDRSDMIPACLYIGRRVSASREILSDESGVPASMGIILEFDELAVKASSSGGEIRVEWTGPDGSFCDLPSTLAPE